MPLVSRRRTSVLAAAALAPLSLLLIAAAAPAHPPVPEAKPAAPAEDNAVPTPNPKTEPIPLPEKRPAPPASAAPPVAAPAPKKPPANTESPETPASPHGKTGEPKAEEGKSAPSTEDTEQKPETEDTKEEERPLPPVPGLLEDGAELAACYKALDALGVVYQKKSTVNDAGRCGMEAPISVTRILPDITLKPANKMRCKTALALTRWTQRVVKPAAEELGKNVHLIGLSHGSAYVCRLRNNADYGKISEHAFGDAIDIVTFDFAGHDPITIEPRERTGKIEEGFQRAVIGGACLYFTTVLGPHADASHQDNLHLDVIERESGFRLCE